MKKIICFVMAAVMLTMLSACGANPRCEYEEAKKALFEAEEVYSYVYADGKGYELEGEELSRMIDGEWVKTGRPAKMEKVISFTVGTQYEICIFEGGSAIIYCGYADVFQSDRQYYSCEIAEDVDDICQYVRENGEEVVIEE